MDRKTVRISISLKNYPLEAVYGAAYVFLDKAYIFLKDKTPQKIEILLKGKKKLSAGQLERIKGEFLNELLNYALRINLAKRNRKMREFIVGQALVGAAGGETVVEEETDIGYEDDPLGIAVPWEEKYGSGKTKKSKSKKKKAKK